MDESFGALEISGIDVSVNRGGAAPASSRPRDLIDAPPLSHHTALRDITNTVSENSGSAKLEVDGVVKGRRASVDPAVANAQREVKKLRAQLQDRDKQIVLLDKQLVITRGQLEELQAQDAKYKSMSREARRMLSAQESTQRAKNAAIARIEGQLQRMSTMEENRLKRKNLELKELSQEFDRMEEQYDAQLAAAEEEVSSLRVAAEERDGLKERLAISETQLSEVEALHIQSDIDTLTALTQANFMLTSMLGSTVDSGTATNAAGSLKQTWIELLQNVTEVQRTHQCLLDDVCAANRKLVEYANNCDAMRLELDRLCAENSHHLSRMEGLRTELSILRDSEISLAKLNENLTAEKHSMETNFESIVRSLEKDLFAAQETLKTHVDLLHQNSKQSVGQQEVIAALESEIAELKFRIEKECKKRSEEEAVWFLRVHTAEERHQAVEAASSEQISQLRCRLDDLERQLSSVNEKYKLAQHKVSELVLQTESDKAAFESVLSESQRRAAMERAAERARNKALTEELNAERQGRIHDNLIAKEEAGKMIADYEFQISDLDEKMRTIMASNSVQVNELTSDYESKIASLADLSLAANDEYKSKIAALCSDYEAQIRESDRLHKCKEADMVAKLAEKATECSALVAQIGELSMHSDDLQRELLAAEASFAQAEHKLMEEHNFELAELRAQFEDRIAQLEREEEAKDQYVALEVGKYVEQCDKYRSEIAELQRSLSDAKARVESVDADQAAEIEAMRAHHNEEMRIIHEACSQLRNERKEVLEKLAFVKAQHKDEVKYLHRERFDLQAQLQAMSSSQSQAVSVAEKTIRKELEACNRLLQSEKEEVLVQLKSQQAINRELDTKCSALQASLDEALYSLEKQVARESPENDAAQVRILQFISMLRLLIYHFLVAMSDLASVGRY
jgi:chromosome segregation ATPase